MRHATSISILSLLALASSACAGDRSAAQNPPAEEISRVTLEETHDIASFMASIPEVDVPALDLETALGLAAMPLACVDRPHATPRNRPGYLDERTTVRRPDYESTRAFYGCYDWHSAVNSTWTMVRIFKDFPDISVGGLIREKLNDHITEETMAGELEYFEEARSFERPYGYAWLLGLYAELSDWDDQEAAGLAELLAPMVELFSQRMITYLESSDYPSRVGVHGNTAFSLAMMLDYTRTTGDHALDSAIVAKAKEFYFDDVDCPTAYEPSGSDFLSPCLEEAKLMSRVLGRAEFVDWFGEFMAPVYSPAFRPLTVAVEVRDDDEALDELNLLGARSHLIGLAFIRAAAMNEIASALPDDDPRVAAYRKLADFHGRTGFDAMFDADYTGSHWIGTFALRYLLSADRVQL
jgi:hypothetical protein